MEVNINNALPIALKLSCGPLLEKIDIGGRLIQRVTCELINACLVKPLFTILMTMSFLLILSTILSISIIVLTGVFCAVVTIIILEGFAVIVCLTATYLGVLIYVLTSTIWFSIQERFSESRPKPLDADSAGPITVEI